MRRFFGYDDVELDQKGGLKVAAKNVLNRMRVGKLAGKSGSGASVFKSVVPGIGGGGGGAGEAGQFPRYPRVISHLHSSSFVLI